MDILSWTVLIYNFFEYLNFVDFNKFTKFNHNEPYEMWWNQFYKNKIYKILDTFWSLIIHKMMRI